MTSNKTLFEVRGYMAPDSRVFDILPETVICTSSSAGFETYGEEVDLDLFGE